MVGSVRRTCVRCGEAELSLSLCLQAFMMMTKLNPNNTGPNRETVIQNYLNMLLRMEVICGVHCLKHVHAMEPSPHLPLATWFSRNSSGQRHTIPRQIARLIFYTFFLHFCCLPSALSSKDLQKAMTQVRARKSIDTGKREKVNCFFIFKYWSSSVIISWFNCFIWMFSFTA